MFLIDLPHCNCITMRDTPSSRRPCVFACLIAASIVNFCYLLCSSARRVLLIGNAKCMARSQLLLSNGLTARPSVSLSVCPSVHLGPFFYFLSPPKATPFIVSLLAFVLLPGRLINSFLFRIFQVYCPLVGVMSAQGRDGQSGLVSVVGQESLEWNIYKIKNENLSGRVNKV